MQDNWKGRIFLLVFHEPLDFSNDCYVSVREMSNISQLFSSLNFNNSCRFMNRNPQYSSAVYQDTNPIVLSQLSQQVIKPNVDIEYYNLFDRILLSLTPDCNNLFKILL